MLVRVLGSAAGGGFPQWNCNCPNCHGVRNQTINAKTRTQSSIAVSSDGIDWVLFNTSHDLLAQLAAFPALQPARQLRLAKFKGITKRTFYLHLKETEFRFNLRRDNVYKTLLKLLRINPI